MALSFWVHLPYCQGILTYPCKQEKLVSHTPEPDNWINWYQRRPEASAGTWFRNLLQVPDSACLYLCLFWKQRRTGRRRGRFILGYNIRSFGHIKHSSDSMHPHIEKKDHIFKSFSGIKILHSLCSEANIFRIDKSLCYASSWGSALFVRFFSVVYLLFL